MRYSTLTCILCGLTLWIWNSARADAYRAVQPLLDTGRTVLDEPIAYPPGNARVSADVVTIRPGEETRWHKHGVPLFGYVLSGEVTVDYGERGTRRFGAGSAFMEARDQWHRGVNRGREPVRILAVYLGSEDADKVILKPGPP